MKLLRKIKFWLTFLLKLLKGIFYKESMILLYHRVEDVKDDPHLLAVSPYNFEKQLSYVKKHFKVISLEDMTKKLKQGNLEKGSVAITFDDGYADNFLNALPILERLQMPATIFVTAGMIGKTESFFWDKETQVPDLGRPLTEKELLELAKNPFIEIGAHTMTHPHLSYLNKNDQEKEILESKKMLEIMTKNKVCSFAYPFGTQNDYNDDTLDIVASNFECACVNDGKCVKKSVNMYKLPRRLVRNDDLAKFITYSL